MFMKILLYGENFRKNLFSVFPLVLHTLADLEEESSPTSKNRDNNTLYSTENNIERFEFSQSGVYIVVTERTNTYPD